MAEKQNFKDVLRARIRERASHRGSLIEFESDEDELVEFVYGIARESFVNGLAAARTRRERPNGKSAFIKGGALKNGKLKPVHSEA